MSSSGEVLAAARSGDGTAFDALLAPHLRALHVHCYRMLGSYADAEEAVQEATLRAWRGLPGYREAAPLRHWLYRIATTTCLKMINRRGRDPLTAAAEVSWLQPYPDALLDQLTDHDADPAAVVARRESIALAFITALQMLPATQRAVLILREVLGWSAREVADLLGTTVAGVNSALQRARATLTDAPDAAPRALTGREQDVLDRFLHAWHACDIPALAVVLRDDVTMTMPPQAIRLVGRDAVVGFLATVPADGRLDRIRLVVTRANGHPALAAYLPDDAEQWDCRGYGIMVLTIHDDRVATITGFPDPSLFPLFDLPATVP
ncbi:RNA polymerase subunit sigma-70 [Cryptosporangium japonicum]|uniref:RNA polymerase subunit sigma-70 n=1 Tax=Cryptosporangium japonicum TaxID=80872 RepID=UPI0031DF96E7